jgi:hypothetical protein
MGASHVRITAHRPRKNAANRTHEDPFFAAKSPLLAKNQEKTAQNAKKDRVFRPIWAFSPKSALHFAEKTV